MIIRSTAIIISLSVWVGVYFNYIHASSSFAISLQTSGEISINEWAKYKGVMPHLQEFTVCHWDKLEYFSDDVSSLWSYCIQNNVNVDFKPSTTL